MWKELETDYSDGMESRRYYDTKSGLIFSIETPSDIDYLRRRMIAAGHNRPDHPVFNPEDYI